MSYSEYTLEQEFLKNLHARINDRLDKDFKVSMPEWDRIDSGSWHIETSLVVGC